MFTGRIAILMCLILSPASSEVAIGHREWAVLDGTAAECLQLTERRGFPMVVETTFLNGGGDVVRRNRNFMDRLSTLSLDVPPESRSIRVHVVNGNGRIVVFATRSGEVIHPSRRSESPHTVPRVEIAAYALAGVAIAAAALRTRRRAQSVA